MSTWRREPEAERWDEEKAVRLLLDAGAVVGGYEAEGARIEPKLRQTYHDHIVEAHNARDMNAYQEAVNGYVEAFREAYHRQQRGDR